MHEQSPAATRLADYPPPVVSGAGFVDLAPSILRQRMVIEGIPIRRITADEIRSYLSALSTELGMITLIEPVTHRSDAYGWAGWIHWETSGAHFYAWEEPTLFFSVDIYTCKPFSPDAAIRFTQRAFGVKALCGRCF